jgi:endonuclease YncB( thermonuclease family)
VSRLRPILLALFVVLVAAPSADAARRGPCLIPGTAATCFTWSGKVTYVADADTIYVDVDGDGTRRTAYVRITGINATEQSVYSKYASRRRGECHALEATARLERLIRRSRGRVRLIAQDPSSHSGRRIRRSVAVKLNGRWRDVGRRLLIEGHALWLPNRAESLWNETYSILAQRAARKGRGIWNPSHCGVGPSEGWPLQLWVNSDAEGHDGFNPGGEWVTVRNLSTTAELPLGGWWVRDSGLRRYTFPSWTTVAPGESIRVYVGEGEDTWTEFFWGLRRAVFDNATSDERRMGDGAFLFDPQGDLRAAMQYPCREQCADPNAGAIEITADVRGREQIRLRNVAAHAVDLAPYRLESPPYAYAFSSDALLQPGETMAIDVEGDPGDDTRLAKAWGETGPILNNGGDRVRLKSYTQVEIGCYAFGKASC